MNELQDLTFQRRGKLFVVRFDGSKKVSASGRKARHWLCRCDCGVLKSYETARLNMTQKYVSCGCTMKAKFQRRIRVKK